MKLLGIAGWSGAGKTTLIEALLAELIGRGLHVSTVKHVHEDIDLDRPGKDSFRHRQAGATDVVLMSPRRWVLLHEVRPPTAVSPADQLAALLPRLTPVDLVLVEGFKTLPHAKIEVWRAGLGKPPLHEVDASIVAVAGDPPIAGCRLPYFAAGDAKGIANFVIATCGLAAPEEG